MAGVPPWLRFVVLLGVTYALVGILFALPSSHVQAWRLSAWVVSAVGFAAHIGYERFRLRNPPLRSARHVALAVGLGAFGLAVGANIHSLAVESSARQHRLLLISLAVWPLIAGLPAFVVALVAGAVLGLRR